MHDKDKKKLVKAGFATPRGGAKGAYQNHVVRSNQVIIPFEKYSIVPLYEYEHGYVVRLLPEQYFEKVGVPKSEFLKPDSPIKVGENAFVLYRTYSSFKNLPPLEGWQVRHLEKDGQSTSKRGKNVLDKGQYVLRISTTATQEGKRSEGAPQGLFAPEYADQETNYLCTCVLAWLIIHTVKSPYTTTMANHLKLILAQDNLLDEAQYEYKGVIKHGLCTCPLCLRFIRYEDLHQIVSFDDAVGNENASDQIEGATRSTVVNLFHILPLRYDYIRHIPENVAWGHAVCNTRLGQRPCHSLAELIDTDLKVGIIKEEGIETFGWISSDYEMIRSPLGAVWVQLSNDMDGDEYTLPQIGDGDEGSIGSSTPIVLQDEEEDVPQDLV
jgi:BstXI restriction endonuclease